MSVKQTPTVAKANGAVETVREGSAASHSSSFNARAHTRKSSTGGAEDCRKNPKTGRLIEGPAQYSPCASTGFPVKRKPGCPRKNPLPQVSPGGTASATAAPAATNAVVPVPARAVDPDACKVPLRKKAEMLHEALEDLPVYVAVGGARAKKGRREGTLEYNVDQQRLMVRSGDTVQSLEGFVEAQLGPKER